MKDGKSEGNQISASIICCSMYQERMCLRVQPSCICSPTFGRDVDRVYFVEVHLKTFIMPTRMLFARDKIMPCAYSNCWKGYDQGIFSTDLEGHFSDIYP